MSTDASCTPLDCRYQLEDDNPKVAVGRCSFEATVTPWWAGRLQRRDPLRDGLWNDSCAHLPLLADFEGQELTRLRKLTACFLRKKDIRGAGGMELTGRMRALIAVQACVPILNLGFGWYRGWVQVLVYPNEFLARHEYQDAAGVVHEDAHARIGESWSHGPVILSWRHAEEDARGGQWGNVVIHEFAHKIDLLGGAPNGMPPLHRGMDPGAWTGAFTDAYDDLWHRCEAGEELPFDGYAAEDPGEFFAVLSEAFFVQPGLVLAVYPEVYRQLALFYRQDPVRRIRAI